MRRALALVSSFLVSLVSLVACGGVVEPSSSSASSTSGDASNDAPGDAIASGGGDDAAASDGSVGRDAGSRDGGASDASRAIPCGGHSACIDDEVCVVTTSSGGPCLMPLDGGVCPNGQPFTGGCCDNSMTTYACRALPSSCAGSLACPCATPLCACGGCQIADAGVLSCNCFYP